MVGAIVNVLLAALKVVFGFLGQSQALIADGLHSFSDLASDVLVIFAAKHASQGADEEHPYGHDRIETAATVVLSLILVAVGIGIGVDALDRLFDPDRLLQPGLLALLVAIVSVLANEGLYQYTHAVAKQLRSNMLHANAWHHRSDAISSLVVIAGIIGSMFGFPYLDAIAAIAVAAMIVKMGWKLGYQSVRELIDTGLEHNRLAMIRRTIMNVAGVRALHMLRTRRMGADALVDVHIMVDPLLSVSEGHQIGETVRLELIKNLDEIRDVTVHIDPEDDESSAPCDELPPREEIVQTLQAKWRDQGLDFASDDITLHYLNGQVQVEVLVALDALQSLEQGPQFAEKIASVAQAVQHIGDIKVRFHVAAQ